MPVYLLVVDIFGLVLAIAGFNMAFRQQRVRSNLNRSRNTGASSHPAGSSDDPVTYILRIGGIMVMIFGIVIAGMMTLVHLAQT